MNWFEDAGVNIDDVSDSGYGFGQAYYAMYVKEVREAKVSGSGKFGMYVICEVAEEKYKNDKACQKVGRWIQVPTPKWVQEEYGVTFNPKEDIQDAKVAAFFIKWLKALGFDMNQIKNGEATEEAIQGRFFAAQLRDTEEDGFTKILWRNPKEYNSGSADGMEVFAQKPDGKSELEKALAGEG